MASKVTPPAHGPALGATIVIPHRDSASYLVEAVSSVMRCHLQVPFEVVVVDDASTSKDSFRTLAELAHQPLVLVIKRDRHAGVQAARNQGISNGRYDFILCLDADDMLREPSNLRKAFITQGLSLMASDDALAFVHTGSWMIGEATGPTISSYPLTPDMIVRKHHVPTSIIFRRSDVSAGAVYDEDVIKWQDWSFGVELLATRWRRGLTSRIAFVPGNQHLYRIHSKSARISNAEVSEYEMTLRTVRRHYDYFVDRYRSSDPAEQLARRVLDAKPTKLADLLFMARYDMRQAQELIARRNARLVTSVDSLGIP